MSDVSPRLLAARNAVLRGGPGPVVLWCEGGHEPYDRLVPTRGWPLACVEVLLCAMYPEGFVVGFIREAEWTDDACFTSILDARTDHFVSTGEDIAESASADECAREYAEREISHRAASLAALVQLPRDFVDAVVGFWEAWYADNPTWNDGKPRVEEAERLAVIRAAVTASRGAGS